CSLASFSFFLSMLPAPSVISTLSLHDALPISVDGSRLLRSRPQLASHGLPDRDRASRSLSAHARSDAVLAGHRAIDGGRHPRVRSEEHTSELQSRENLVCRLLLEKKKTKKDKK